MADRRLQNFVTEMDLQLAQLSSGCVSFLSYHMPPVPDEGGAETKGLDYEKWLDEAFLEE